MEDPDFVVFAKLYAEAYARCFNKLFTGAISETESKLFYQQIFEKTGLTIGWRSLKNYSFFVLDKSRDENPSVASMDTLARYVLQAPYTNEIARKNDEGHHPYWFMYRSKNLTLAGADKPSGNKKILFTSVLVLVFTAAAFLWFRGKHELSVNEDFADLSAMHLTNTGWSVLGKDSAYWAKRAGRPGSLTLFTLQGDNWPDGNTPPEIKNLLVHALPDGCFNAELQMQNFVPMAEWQQAGLLLLEDTTLNSPSVRVSLAYNDMFGGYNKPKEVLVQAIVSAGQNNKPEEFAHSTVMLLDSIRLKPTLADNLKYTALRIEGTDKHYRFLYAGGNTPNAAFKEVAAKDISFKPRYIALFALKGRVPNTPVVPVTVKKFIMQTANCE
ncbi:hypothetical protein [Mucilaginibacter sp. AK015]|uniref:hypothetical protein n=1 Tax=Mucilaginibacter sp. AK015 TaxID=2723072 RepID=UPI00160B5160|nr:hypothetical protein [Mucilaginibacter sp. AK015]MBB5395963.1 hypothetical protein [Mucilaginibacter sp. AK015]